MAAKKKKKATAKKAKPKHAMQRKDYNAPIDAWFKKRPPHQRAIVEKLRKLVEEAAPDATSAIKWGNPVYNLGKIMFAIISAHKAHVNLIFTGPSDLFDDPKGALSGTSKLGRHLALTSLDEIPIADVKRWLALSAKLARG